ncbi:hypothetical protein SGLAM104S_04411 [Streptomyces glaucescens]
MLKTRRLPSTPFTMGIARMMGTAPRSPAQDMRVCSCHGTRNGVRHSTTLSGRATMVRTRPMTSPGRTSSPSSYGVDEEAEQDEHADLGEPAESVGEAAGGGPVRQPARCHIAMEGEVDGEEAAAVGECRPPRTRRPR